MKNQATQKSVSRTSKEFIQSLNPLEKTIVHNKRRKKNNTASFVTITTSRKNNILHHSFKKLDNETTTVHIHGHLCVWAIKEIIKNCPNLKKIQLIPSQFIQLSETHKNLCKPKDITFTEGHCRPNLIWKNYKPISPNYHKKKTFLLSLKGKQKNLFDELLNLGFEAGKITSNYFCLKNEPYIPQRELAKHFGYKYQISISIAINSVLRYINPSFKTSIDASDKAIRLKKQVKKLRKVISSKKALDNFIKIELRLKKLPEKLFPSRYKLFAKVVQAKRNGLLSKLRKTNPDLSKIITLRFGSFNFDEKCLTLHQIAKLQSVSRECIRQKEEKALKILGIDTN